MTRLFVLLAGMVFAVVAALQVGTAPVARADGAPAGYDREVGAPCRIIAAGATVRRVQAVVGVTQDGVLGPGTCDAIKSFQCTKNLTVDGVVGPITWGVMNGDPVPAGTRVCANLTRQTLWVAKGGQRTYTATRMRSGDPRLPNSSTTPTGNFTIYWKDKDHVSSIFDSPMPYSMFFHRGQAIHGSTFTLPGSHGCINVTMDDARRVWNRAAVGTPVSIWGVRPL